MPGNLDDDGEGMTENNNPEHIDIFYRQALLAGNRVPVIWGGPFELLKMLHEEADVDVGVWGQATDGIMEVESDEQAKEIPWAARYMKCKDDMQDLCNNEPRFCSTCWIDRDDGINPEAKQLDKPRGQVKWHPGWRSHQLTGRNIAFALLEALQAAINIWNEGVMGELFFHSFQMLFCETTGLSHPHAFPQVDPHWKTSFGMLQTTMRTFETKSLILTRS